MRSTMTGPLEASARAVKSAQTTSVEDELDESALGGVDCGVDLTCPVFAQRTTIAERKCWVMLTDHPDGVGALSRIVLTQHGEMWAEMVSAYIIATHSASGRNHLLESAGAMGVFSSIKQGSIQTFLAKYHPQHVDD